MGTRKRNVLVFPAGTEIGLEICAALKHCKEVALFGAGQDISTHARFAYPEYHVVPSIHDPGWLVELVELVKRLQIEYVFPAYDDVIVALSQAGDRLPAIVLSSPSRTCEITRSKSATYKALGGSVRVPRLFTSADEVDRYPVFVKPDCGQGSQGVRCVRTAQDLPAALSCVRSPIICEYLSGDEFTIDCFSDRERGLLFAKARSRNRIRNGISVNTVSVDLPEAWDFAQKIGTQMVFHGAWFFQLKRASDGELVLLEVAPRISGSMAAHRVTGVNFPLLSIFEQERLPIRMMTNPGEVELDRALCNRFKHQVHFATAYVDLDDTLLLNDKVNLLVIKFLYQCINQNIRIKLLTRHRGDLESTLKKYHLSFTFDDIIHIPEGGRKSDLITERDAVFVDDSFSERHEVADRCGIRTFDCSMLELLTEQAETLNRGLRNESA